MTPGRRYGGSSSVNADASPRRIVFDSAHDTASVKIDADQHDAAATVPAAANEANAGGNAAPTKIVASMISVGKRPLQGTKLLVRIAIEPFARRVDDARGDDAGGVAAESHRHRQRLLAVRAGALEQEVEIERDARQIAEIFENREQREEDRHRRQHHADHPGEALDRRRAR